MPITANTLYRDTMNFTRNQFISILMMSLLTAFITVILDHAISSSEDELQILSNSGFMDLIQQMTPEQQTVLMKMLAANAGVFPTLLGNVLLTGGVLMLIQLVSDGQRTSALRAIGASAPFLLRLLILILLCTLLIQFGIMFLIVPGVLLAIAFSLSPVIMITEKCGVFRAIKASAKLAYGNLRAVSPAIVVWLLANLLTKIAIFLVVLTLPNSSPTVLGVVLNGLGNLISAILLIYLFRLYMLLRA